MVPNGWSQNRLSEIAKVVDCKHRTPSYVGEGIPVISPGTVKWGELDLVTPSKRVTIDDFESLMDHCKIEIGDLVFSRNQSIGVASFVINKTKFVLGQDTVLIKAMKIEWKYLFYCLQSNNTQKKIFRLAGGSTFFRINLKDIRGLILVQPPILEQTKIAKILSTWDKAIETVEKLIINSQQQKKALMQQLLTGKKRFLGFEKDWGKCFIRQMGKVVSGGAPDTKVDKYWNGDVLWVTPTDITALTSRFISNTKRKISEEGVRKSSATLLAQESLLVCTRATIGHMAIATTPVTTNQGFKSLVLNDEFHVDFIYYLFSFNKSNFIRYACGSTFLEISKKDFEKLIFKCPSKDEQKKISSVLSNCDNEIGTLQSKLEYLKQEKKALMQQLLTGKRRVKIDKSLPAIKASEA